MMSRQNALKHETPLAGGVSVKPLQCDAARWTATARMVPNAREIYPITPTEDKR